MITNGRGEKSLGELFSELSRELSTLVRQEARLAKTELSEKAGHLVKDVGLLGAGGAIAYAGFLTILAAMVLLLALVLPAWLAAFVVGVIVAIVGGVLIQQGRHGLQESDLAPRQTLASLKETTQWAKEQTH